MADLTVVRSIMPARHSTHMICASRALIEHNRALYPRAVSNLDMHNQVCPCAAMVLPLYAEARSVCSAEPRFASFAKR